MKFPGYSIWKFWQTPALRSFIKKRSKIRTPHEALNVKEFRSILYFFFTLGVFNYFFYGEIMKNREGKNPEEETLKLAMKMRLDEGKIIKIDNFKLTEVKDFDRDDHEHLLEEK